MACWPQQEAFPELRWDHCILLLPFPGAFSFHAQWQPHTQSQPEHGGCWRTQGREGTWHGDSARRAGSLQSQAASAQPGTLTHTQVACYHHFKRRAGSTYFFSLKCKLIYKKWNCKLMKHFKILHNTRLILTLQYFLQLIPPLTPPSGTSSSNLTD